MAAITDLATLTGGEITDTDYLVVNDVSAATDKKAVVGVFPIKRMISKSNIADNVATALARLQASNFPGYASAHLLIVSAGGSHASVHAYIGIWSYGTFTLVSLASALTNSGSLTLSVATVNTSTPYVDFNVTHDSSLGQTATIYLTVLPLHSNEFVAFTVTAL